MKGPTDPVDLCGHRTSLAKYTGSVTVEIRLYSPQEHMFLQLAANTKDIDRLHN
jgi:hypothetical protein